jgi:hypothetical protein
MYSRWEVGQTAAERVMNEAQRSEDLKLLAKRQKVRSSQGGGRKTRDLAHSK